MKRISFRILSIISLCLLCAVSQAFAVQYIDAPPLKSVLTDSVGPDQGNNTLPLITWGGDIATILANGSDVNTQANSIFAKKDLNFKLVRIDDFRKQAQMLVRGELSYVRGTLGMVNQLAEITKGTDAEVKVIYQLTWSRGGDCVVVKEGINSVKDLKGKTIILQAYGPHVDYAVKMLADAGLTPNDVNIKWVKDLTGTENTPGEAFATDNTVDAAFVIIPDGLALTEGDMAVRGAKILMSTKSASHVIADVYAVRKDHYEANTEEVKNFVHGLLLAEQELRGIMRNKQSNTAVFNTLMKSSAKILLDTEDMVADAEGLYNDCEYVGFQGNTEFFGNTSSPIAFEKMSNDIQKGLINAGLMSATVAMNHARFDYDTLREGLVGIDAVKAPVFKAEKVQEIINKMQAEGTLTQGTLFEYEIHFSNNQNSFSLNAYDEFYEKKTGKKITYGQKFAEIVNTLASYGGAVLTIEGHSDPHKYLSMKECKDKGEMYYPTKKDKSNLINGILVTDQVLNDTAQSAKNLSMGRALNVRQTIIDMANNQGIPFDKSQFTVVPHGINSPKWNPPTTKEEWLDNMRVVFRIMQIEAEADAFEPEFE